jgi:ribonuclease HI
VRGWPAARSSRGPQKQIPITLKRPRLVDVHTDSQYLRNSVMSWIKQWKRNDWRTSDRKPVKNVDLWQRLDELLTKHRVHWYWVRGHAGHAENERADQLAREGLLEARSGAEHAARPMAGGRD